MSRPPMLTLLLVAALFAPTTVARAQFRVISYHAHPNFNYSDALFTQHMDFLRDNGYHTVSGDQFMGWLQNNDPLPIRPLLLAFDDNYVRVYTSAAPILLARGFQAINFAHTDYVGVPGTNDHADWIEINSMETGGVMRTESHTKTHPNLTTLSPDSLTTELEGSKAAIEANIPGKTCRYLAYPGGAYDSTVTSAVQQAGYAAAFTVIEDVNYHDTPVCEIRRLFCDGSDLNTFKTKIGFNALPPSPPGPGWTIDNKDVNFFYQTSQWQASTLSGAYGSDCLRRSAGASGVQARWAAYLPQTGTWRVHAWWVAGADRSPTAVYWVTHTDGVTPAPVNQRVNGGQWNLLGTFNFSSTSPAQVVLPESADGVVVADGIWFEPVTSGVSDFLRY